MSEMKDMDERAEAIKEQIARMRALRDVLPYILLFTLPVLGFVAGLLIALVFE